MLGLKPREPKPERRALQVLPWGDWGTSYSGGAGMSVSPDSSLNLLTVYGCVQLISDTIAMLPRHVYRELGNGTNVEVATPRWLKYPNSSCNIVDFLTQTLSSLLLDGNAYWAYGVDRNLTPSEIRCVPPTEVTVRDQGQGVEYWIRGQRYTGRLLHIRGIMRPGALKGVSPVEAARQAIGNGLASQQFAGSFFANGITPSGAVTTDADLTADQARDLAKQITAAHGGAAQSFKPMILDNGAKWEALSVTPEQAQFLESQKFQAGTIAGQMFLLDPTMLGIAVDSGSSLTYANLEQRGIHLVQFTLLRWITRLEAAFYELLPRPQYLKFNVNGLLRADLKTRYESYRIGLGNNVPFIAQNEAREFEELHPMPGGDMLPVTSPAPTEPISEPAGAEP